MNYYIGIDLGGTNVRVAKFDENMNIIQDIIKPSHGIEGPKEVVRDIIFGMLDEIDNLSECVGIGIGVPGAVDSVRKVMTISSNLNGFKDYPIASLIEEKYHIPCFIDNDANVAGLSEAIVGSGKDYDSVYYITHSTGIGGAFILNKKIVSGKNGYAGEIGNIIIDRQREKINSLNAGAVESEASGTAISRKGRQLFNNIENARDIFDLAIKGDDKAIKLLDDVSRDFAQLLSSIAHVVDPCCFIIGGGVSKASDYYFPIVKKYFDEMVHPVMKDTPILKAGLKEPGVLGAALLAKTNINK